MHLLSVTAAAAHISGILHPKYQAHGFSVQLTARKNIPGGHDRARRLRRKQVYCCRPCGDRAQQLRPEDNYLWWNLNREGYFFEFNETLNLAPNEIVLIESEDQLLEAGVYRVPSPVRWHVEPVPLLLQVVAAMLRANETARNSLVRLFLIDEIKSATIPEVPAKADPRNQRPQSGTNNVTYNKAFTQSLI
jgi:hypothetical protein